MRELFDIIKNNYDPNGKPYIRPSVRGIIIKDKKIAVVHSMMYDYYKYPGGGMDEGEDNIATLIREVKEEAGLDVIVDSIREYGHVLRKEKGHPEDIFIQDNYYYLCEAENEPISQELDEYEAKESYRLEYIDAETAIGKNRNVKDSPYNNMMFEREALVLELLQSEGLLN